MVETDIVDFAAFVEDEEFAFERVDLLEESAVDENGGFVPAEANTDPRLVLHL